MFKYLKLKYKIKEQEGVINYLNIVVSKNNSEIKNLKEEEKEEIYTTRYAVNLLKIDHIDLKRKDRIYSLVFSSAGKEILFCWLRGFETEKIFKAYEEAVRNMGKPIVLSMDGINLFKFINLESKTND